MNTNRPIRVLVVDDSPTMVNTMATLLSQEPRIEIVGRAGDGNRAVSLARLLRPDVITMDLLLPGLDGPAAIAAIMSDAPARILVVSAVADRGADLGFQAIRAGALELIAKPNVTSGEELRKWGRELTNSICLMAEVPVISRRKIREVVPPLLSKGARVDIFGLAASTGGPPALAEILSRLPKDLPVPIVVAQHITEGFTPGMVRWLSQVTPLGVSIARDGERLEPGKVYFPLDGHDLTIDRGLARLSPTRGGPCPSGDLLLSSLSRVYGGRAGGGVLTGMGDDGARGLLDIRRSGGVTMAQDEASSVVFGMPKAALDIGATEQALPLSAMPDFIRNCCLKPSYDRPRGDGA
ncbi:chemotaxis protein CheB [Hyalangium minutum]|uniref:Protein-glutamate methylesterase/protein-glutamine glutaminase n=1 Tax=Hyalangium minutum TaxID=394096 RepID=A0A085W9C3_9BACT|nr:chemotaxis protein CheB [Hyalangium minutum]KFE64286.1 Chemotaxis response regulator protein-glutamate methylesterase CheB [Hyalangium minutum]